MARSTILSVFLVFWAVGARADLDAAHQACDEAAAAYAAEDYSTAASSYQRALDAGLETAVVHFNLGNARFKNGELGAAIASYLRAERIDPSDAAVRTNLERARAQIKDLELSGTEVPPVLRPFRWLWSRVSANQWLGLGLVIWFLLAGTRILGHWWTTSSERYRTVGITLLVLGLATFLAGAGRYHHDFVVDRAVVVAEEVEVRSGPGTGYNLAFRVHEGLPVRVAEDRGDWLRIDLGGELVGWVRASALESI
jgi:tetratricopeptide (TPR) repeat protein